jgi:ribosomal protein S4
VRPGEVVTIRDKSKKSIGAIVEAADAGSIVPPWMEVNREEFTITVQRLPAGEEIFRPFETNMQHVIEFIR